MSSGRTHPSAVVTHWLQNCKLTKLGHGRRLRCAFASPNPSAVVANSCTHRRRDSTKQFRRRRRRCVLGLRLADQTVGHLRLEVVEHDDISPGVSSLACLARTATLYFDLQRKPARLPRISHRLRDKTTVAIGFAKIRSFDG